METTFETKEMNLSLNVDTITNLSVRSTKLDHCVESVGVPRFF